MSGVRPSKIIGVGRNFRAHAQELGNEMPAQPILFSAPFP
jgi:2-keto-4-pentenoate hydratase/2-oxohepta-3-ene-1,7-dioic acid hydratase in catechol pathway